MISTRLELSQTAKEIQVLPKCLLFTLDEVSGALPDLLDLWVLCPLLFTLQEQTWLSES